MVQFSKVINSLIEVLKLSGAREKLVRMIQYICKFIDTFLGQKYEIQIHRRTQIKSRIQKTQTIMMLMAMTRKMLRFGPQVVMLKTIISNIQDIIKSKNKQPTHIVILRTISSMFTTIFFLVDHYILLFILGITSNKQLKLKCDQLTSLCWLCSCITDLIKNLAIYYNKKPKQRQAVGKELLIDSIRAAADLLPSYSFLYPGTVNGKYTGVLATISSAIGLYQLIK